MLSANVILAALVAFPEGTPVVTAPMVKLPPIFTLLYLAVIFRLALAAIVPPLILRAPVPIPLTPPKTMVPALRVKPPVYPLPLPE
jgi:hypothetical protein